MGIIVTLETFSGRPNPEWSLSPGQIAEFEQRLGGLTPIPSPGIAKQDEPLGYRGFHVRGGATLVSAFRGQVTDGRRILADPGRKFERWLLETGRASIDPALAAYVDSEITSGP